jgi:hypothetical protein
VDSFANHLVKHGVFSLSVPKLCFLRSSLTLDVCDLIPVAS